LVNSRTSNGLELARDPKKKGTWFHDATKKGVRGCEKRV